MPHPYTEASLAISMLSSITFLLPSLLWALPLAALPVLLHLLFRRRSPIVPFSTLRFIRSSLLHTAARRKVQRWVLLACRVILLGLLIAAAAGPRRKPTAEWVPTGPGRVAAIVVDTSYSMELGGEIEGQPASLLHKADGIVQDLLRTTLKDMNVAVFRSRPPADGSPVRLVTASELLKDWRPLSPEPAPDALGTRVAAAINLLSHQTTAVQKWLIIISDLQSREFPTPLPPTENTRVVLFDLHPDNADSAGVTAVRIEPDQPIPGIGAQAVAEVAGRAGDAKALTLSVLPLKGDALKTKPPVMANFATTGRTQVRFDLRDGLPAERWLIVRAALQAKDAMPWDDQRDTVIEMPPRQSVTILTNPAQQPAESFIRLVLDPWEGKDKAWPLSVRTATDLSEQEHVAIALLSQWPSEDRAVRLREFARRGGTVILFLQPGLEQSFAQLDDTRKALMTALLPSVPLANVATSSAYRAAAAPGQDRLLQGLTDEAFRLSDVVVRRFVPLAKPETQDVTPLLVLWPAHPMQGARNFGLLARKTIGTGAVYTIPTLPDSSCTNLPMHPLFLPIMVRMSLRPAAHSDAQNVEIGKPLFLPAGRFAGQSRLRIECPDGAIEEVPITPDQNGRWFLYRKTDAPGRYYWHKVDDPQAILAVGNVQLPSAESELTYRAADTIVTPGPDTLIVRSFEQFRTTMPSINAPRPRWPAVIAIVLLLLCAEALLGSLSQLWKPLSIGSFLPKFLGATT